VDFAAITKTMAGMGRLKRICKDEFCVAVAVQETSPSDMVGCQEFLRFGAVHFHFLRKPRRIAPVQVPFFEEISHNCFLSDR
jgi:hypothetical protein